MDNWKKLSDKTKKMIIAIAAGTAVIAIIGVLGLNIGKRTDFSTLFTGLNQDEAQTVVSLLQEQGIDYKYSNNDGTIRVPAPNVDRTRATLLSQGYPKSGFTYDMYRDNAGIMTTESDKKLYTLYELQDRLGSQIRLFEGVRDAKVTIAEAETQKFALNDDALTEASASVVVTMKNGQILGDNTAAAIKNLIARSVRGMNFTNVAVFDAMTMIEVGSSGSGEGGGLGSTKDMTALTSLIENNIAGNVRLVLGQLYGQDNIAVSVKGTLNMEKLIQENTQYMAPDKINEQDKSGLLNKEDVTNENSAAANQGGGGVAGADANADAPRYTNNNGNQNTANNYANSSASREWLYNSLKEQRQVDPGVLENTTIGVVINTNDTTVSEEDLINLIANSAGIPRSEANEKITVIRALNQTSLTGGAEGESADDSIETGGGKAGWKWTPGTILVVVAAAAGLVLLILILILVLGRRKRRAEEHQDGIQFSDPNAEEAVEEFPGKPKKPAVLPDIVDEEMERNEEILNLRMQHSLKLKQNIGEFVDQNPQIAAKLVQSWLRGEGDIDGSHSADSAIKRK